MFTGLSEPKGKKIHVKGKKIHVKKRLQRKDYFFFLYFCFMDTALIQDNRITSARYELTLLEKRILYVLIKDIRNKYVSKGNVNTTLFDDMIINISSTNLLSQIKETNPKSVKNALRKLNSRVFECDNGVPESDPEHEWLIVNFINYGKWKKQGGIEFQVSKEILPFFVELTKNFTEYSLVVAMSLKSKWSQRFYEICCQWKNAGGTILNLKDLRKQFELTDKYVKYNTLKKYVISAAHKELKELYKKGECDVYFEFSELKESRSVEALRLKIISKDKNTEVAKDVDITHIVREQLYSIFEVEKKPKNKEKIQKLISFLILNTEKLYTVYGKIQYTKDKKPRSEWQKYLRAVFNSEYDFQNL